MSTEAQKRASAKYAKSSTIMTAIKLNKKTDADIIEKLEQEPNKQGYIKDLIRKDLTQKSPG